MMAAEDLYRWPPTAQSMNPFEKLGRSAQRLKHKAVGPSDADVVFVCKNCEAQFTEQSNECPECDSTDIVAVEP